MNLIKNNYSIYELQHYIINNNVSYNDWWCISIYQDLTESFIKRYSDKLHWDNISFYQSLSEAFIEKHIDKIDWYNISRQQKLSEKFIEKYTDKVYWSVISVRQKLSYEFLEKHLYKYNLYKFSICMYHDINREYSNRLRVKYEYKYQIDKLEHELNRKKI